MLSSCSKRLLLHDPHASWCLRFNYGCYDEVIRDISWSDDGKYLLQVNPKGLVEILNATDTEVKSLQHVPQKETWAACFHRDGHRHIAVGSKSGHVSVWDTKIKNICKSFPLPAQPAPVNILSFNAKNTNIAGTMQNGDTIVYGTTSNSAVLTVRVPRSKSISAMKFHHESRSLLGLATDEGHILLKDISTNKDKVFFKSIHASPVSDFTFSQINRDVMLSCGYDKNVKVYDVRSENTVSNIETNYPLTSITINPDNQIALGTRKGLVIVYDLRDLDDPLTIIDDHTDEIRRVAFQPLKCKLLSSELSLKEELSQHVSPHYARSPPSSRNTDLFLHCDTPSPKLQSEKSTVELSRVDSFLYKLGLDKSSVEESFYTKKTSENSKNNLTDVHYHKWDNQSIAKSSTPLSAKTGEKIVTPSFSDPSQSEQMITEQPTANIVNAVQNQGDRVSNETLHEFGEELRNIIRMSVADLADDNRNYYLSLLMQLTKQKLFMENQMSTMMQQMQGMQLKQDALAEENRRLAMDIEILKASASHTNY